MVEVRRIYELAKEKEIIFGQRSVKLGQTVIWHNVADFSQRSADHLNKEVYIDRIANVDSVITVKLYESSLVDGDTYSLYSNGCIVYEQLGPQHGGDGSKVSSLFDPSRAVIDVKEECLLVARYGEGTWGHWLGEILPRAVIAESIAPGKYTFVVPAWTTQEDSISPLARNTLDSLAAYGIGRDRLLRLEGGKLYRFQQLNSISSVWSDKTIHPAVATLMRRSLTQNIPDVDIGNESIALLRYDGRRAIENMDLVLGVLEHQGFLRVDIGQMPFVRQVATFRSAKNVFSILGSSLTGLIYSPYGVKVATVAPGAWLDRFFYALVQRLDGKYVDVRGTPVPQEGAFERDYSFTVDIAKLQQALNALRSIGSQ
jgi:hypothetical protein